MAKIPRQELDELYAKYDFHPGLFDIYVEGDFDCDFFSRFLTKTQSHIATSVLAIDNIDIPDSKLSEYGLPLGSNKSRVIALSKLLDERYSTRETNIVCIVDADDDRIRNRFHEQHHLFYTDYTCIEMYLLNRPTIGDFFQFTCQLPNTEYTKFIAICEKYFPYNLFLEP